MFSISTGAIFFPNSNSTSALSLYPFPNDTHVTLLPGASSSCACAIHTLPIAPFLLYHS